MSIKFKRQSIGARRFLKRLMPQTLFGRSLLILITPVFLIQIITTIVFFDRHWARMTSRLSYAIAGEVNLVADIMIERGLNSESLQHFSKLSGSTLNLDVEYIPDEFIERSSNANPFPLSWREMIRSSLVEELAHASERKFNVVLDSEGQWVNIDLQLEHGVIKFTLPQKRLFSSTSYIFLIWSFCVSTVLLVIAVLFMRNQIRPIRRLAYAAERFGRGHEVSAFKTEGAREVRLAGQAFVDMKERIKRQISQRTEMLAGVSHDLRTPLTRLKLQVAMMGDGPDIYEMKRDITEMERMIDGYLNFVRGDGVEPMRKVDLCSLLQDVASGLKRQGMDVHIALPEAPVQIDIRSTSFRRGITNVTSNAVKYASKIWISLNLDDENRLSIIIEDNGPGIDEENYDDVFRPFYRVDSSRNTQTGGVGLGLPITMDIVHSHGGEMKLAKSQHGGLAVYINLPY